MCFVVFAYIVVQYAAHYSVSLGVVCIVYWQAALPFEWPQTQIMTTADVEFESISDEYFKQQVISVDFALVTPLSLYLQPRRR